MSPLPSPRRKFFLATEILRFLLSWLLGSYGRAPGPQRGRLAGGQEVGRKESNQSQKLVHPQDFKHLRIARGEEVALLAPAPVF